MGGFKDSMPAIAMVALQFSYSVVALITRAALLQGMSPSVFIVYRQAIATLVMTPVAYFSRRKSRSSCSIGFRSFYLIFCTSLIGVTINQNVYFEGLYLASSSMASAMGNLVPAVTLVIAFFLGLEKIKVGSLRSMAKVLGTVICVAGAIAMALLKGPKLLNSDLLGGDENWLLGCSFLFASCCCWSIWLILQVPVSAQFPDHLSLSAWMCFMATVQSAIVALFLEPNLQAWNFNSPLELVCCLFTGIIGSGVSFGVQAWCVSQRGPLYTAMFSPLTTLIVTILASIFLHEKIYTGGLVGGIGVILGLYILLWGKAEDIEMIEHSDPESQNGADTKQVDQEDPFATEYMCKIDLEEPLLSDISPISCQKTQNKDTCH